MANTVGQELPEMTLMGSDQKEYQLPQDLKGQWTLLYFYRKDDTPGCTKQACSYRDQIGSFTNLGVKVLGVSGDDLQSHDAFIGKFELNFPLLADVSNTLSTALGVYGEQEWNGKKYMGLSRDTFLINPDGKVETEWRKVNPTTTVQETLEVIQQKLK